MMNMWILIYKKKEPSVRKALFDIYYEIILFYDHPLGYRACTSLDRVEINTRIKVCSINDHRMCSCWHLAKILMINSLSHKVADL